MGAGAVGCFIGARLALAGHEAVLVGRPTLVAAIQDAGGLNLLGPAGDRIFAMGLTAATSIAVALGDHGQPDLAIVAVKAYDTGEAAEQLRAAGLAGPVLTLQNGIGNEEVLAEALGVGSVVAGAIETPVSVPAPGTVQIHRARYQVGLAPVGSQAPATVAGRALSDSGLVVTCFGDHRSLKWTKLLMNLPANALCAILRWSPAQVMEDRASAHLEAGAPGRKGSLGDGAGPDPGRLPSPATRFPSWCRSRAGCRRPGWLWACAVSCPAGEGARCLPFRWPWRPAAAPR